MYLMVFSSSGGRRKKEKEGYFEIQPLIFAKIYEKRVVN